jgi:hypothetical protein
MRKYALSLAVILATMTTFAQYDTSRLDVGYLSLNKEFTQTVTIKGADLEKMPFANLSDAIGVWAYGAYTTPGTLLYVVDGNPVSDVNVYNIHDVEEIVLVQNATALMGTGGTQQEVVLITTRRGKGKGGITAAAQSGLVNASSKGASTPTNWYHDYYVSAYRNVKKLSFGVSGDFQRDVDPQYEPPADGLKINTPDNLQRWRLNGYLTWRPDAHNQIDLMLNYTPETLAMEVGQQGTNLSSDDKNLAHQHYFLPRLRWHSELLPGLKNDLQAVYLKSTYRENDHDLETNAGQSSEYDYYDTVHAYHLQLRDRLAYTIHAGAWSVEPAFNASYEHISNRDGYEQFAQSGQLSLNSGFQRSQYNTWQGGKGNLVFLTPALDISWRHTLDIQGGVLLDVSSHSPEGNRKTLPFASVTLDVLKLSKKESQSSLKLFGSYAKRDILSTNDYALADLQYNYGTTAYLIGGNQLVTGVNPITPISVVSTQPGTIGPISAVVPINPPAYWVWEAGATFTTLHDRLRVQYTLERRNFFEILLEQDPGGPLVQVNTTWQTTLHHADLRIKVLDGGGWSWQTGLNTTLMRSKTNVSLPYGVKPIVGDINGDPYSWTGGWVNRVRYKSFTAGVDVLYHFGERNYNPARTSEQKNPYYTPNVYLGYDMPIAKGKPLEVFIASRGLIHSTNNDLSDGRRYYTIGGKFSL